ncbi:hypothetical protein [Rhodospirillum rubrum]|uniref:Uncharacterized protein n=1 Tax=Rhodospirillum rubrum (strain ATCC 11170 / ATH 1.1.1 / DSM 467 / LMG 4362 / NCIMB 8255 / S1) TaxID=269796 RepID=Q2RNU2_RHORT|nr:hypothetical protein [Rhodospirillum rubrum]ABC24203.1 hypothetical protein Rru_A3409 [Rhodospirillum rubrum ATCC 11170]AEO49954.1 hypothetical protein F11_17470 [Rhodospirillum rubrum F11]MBK5955921.1 hypothetical protein [Rhodospirillum rubrum]QXG80139.1 hypothetical protein KUL73_17605 [Rhodospirillum rubrum]HCF19054.1 hypothetical protein [Rhodospirillum rubrum]
MADQALDAARLKTAQDVLDLLRSDWLLAHRALDSGDLLSAVETVGDVALTEAVRSAAVMEVENDAGNAFNATAVRLFYLEMALGDPAMPTFHGVGLRADSLAHYLRDCFEGKPVAADPEFFIKMLYALSLLQHASHFTGDTEYFDGLHEAWKRELALFLIYATMYSLEGMPDELVSAIVLGDEADDDVGTSMLAALKASYDADKTEITVQAGVVGFFVLNTTAIERPALMLLGCLTEEDHAAIQEATAQEITPDIAGHALFTTLGDTSNGSPAQLLWGQLLASIIRQIESRD